MLEWLWWGTGLYILAVGATEPCRIISTCGLHDQPLNVTVLIRAVHRGQICSHWNTPFLKRKETANQMIPKKKHTCKKCKLSWLPLLLTKSRLLERIWNSDHGTLSNLWDTLCKWLGVHFQKRNKKGILKGVVNHSLSITILFTPNVYKAYQTTQSFRNNNSPPAVARTIMAHTSPVRSFMLKTLQKMMITFSEEIRSFRGNAMNI